MKNHLDIEQNRATRNYPLRVQGLRMAWAVGRLVFRLIPRLFYAPRCFLLRCFGATIGKQVHISNTVQIDFPWNLDVADWAAVGERARLYSLGKITIGTKATVSQGAHLCAGSHDYMDPSLPLQTPPIVIGDEAWICADAFVGPNVAVGAGAVVGARAVVMKNVEAWTVVAGNPAQFIRKRDLMESE